MNSRTDQDNEDLRKRIASLEEKWSQIETGQAYANEKRELSNAGLKNEYLARVTKFYSEGNSYRVANPGPLGLFAFGYTTALGQGFNTKWTEEGTNDLTYCFALLFGGLIQLLAGMWELYRNNTFGGTAFSCFGGYQLGFGIYGILVSSGVLSPPAGYIHGMQMFLIIWGVLAFIFWIASLAVNIALQILFLSLTTTYFLLAAGLDDHPRVIKAGGYFGVFTALVAWYLGTAELLNSVYRRKVLPIGVINLSNKEPSLTGIARPDTL